MPVDGCLNAPGLTVEVTITRSRHTIGDDQPRPGTSTFHATFFSADHRIGRLSISATPRPDAPRNRGQIVSAGAVGAAAGPDASSSSSRLAIASRIREVYTRSQSGLPATARSCAHDPSTCCAALSDLFAFGNEAAR